MADSRDQVDLTTQSTDDILGEIFESLGDLPAAPDPSGPATTERDRADLRVSSTSTFQVVSRESLDDPGHRGDGLSRERDELDILLAENDGREASGSGLAERSSMVEIDSALVGLPAGTNSGESGGDELSEAERIIRGDDHRPHRTETNSGDERDRAASQAIESTRSEVLTDEVLLQGLSTPRGSSRVLEGSEPPSGGSANGGTHSPRNSVERALRALPEFVGMPGMSFDVSATALDRTAGTESEVLPLRQEYPRGSVLVPTLPPPIGAHRRAALWKTEIGHMGG